MEPEHIVDDGTSEWHLVSPARSGRPSLECSERSGLASRPHTPATSAPEHPAEEGSRALGVPSEPTAAAFPSPALVEQAAHAGDGGIADVAVDEHEVAPRTATDDEALLGVQGLSQEGSLEGFTTTTTTTTLPQDPAPEPATHATPAATEPSAAAEQEAAVAPADVEAAPPAKRLAADEEGDSWLLGLADGNNLGVGAGLHLPGMGTLFELLGEGLGWTQGYLLEACRAGLQNLQLYLALTQQTLARGAVSVAGGAALAHQQAHLHLADALTRAHKMMHAHLPRRSPTTGTAAEEGEAVKARPNHAALAPLSLRGGLLVGALGITTIASLAGLIFYLGRCRQLTAQLQQRDRELARLVVKILNLQDALQQPRAGPPVLRQTRLLSVTSSLM